MLLPTWLAVARAERGVTETPGPKSTARIGEYLVTVGMAPDDEIAWCSAFVHWCLKRVGIKGVGLPAARSWLSWGIECERKPGAICVLWREHPDSGKGHVGFCDPRGTEADDGVVLLGGNQSNKVCWASFPSSRVLGYRWPDPRTIFAQRA